MVISANFDTKTNVMRNFTTLLLSIICAYSCSAQPGTGYTTFRGNAAHTGIYQSEPVRDNPGIKWKFKTNGRVYTSAAIDGNHIYFGSTDSTLYCVDIASGNLDWKFQTGGAVSSSP